MTDEAKAKLRAQMEEARQRKQDYDRTHPHPASPTARNGALQDVGSGDKDPERSRDALDTPTRKRSHTPRTGDG